MPRPDLAGLRFGTQARFRLQGRSSEGDAATSPLQAALDNGVEESQVERELFGLLTVETKDVAYRGFPVADEGDETEDVLIAPDDEVRVVLTEGVLQCAEITRRKLHGADVGLAPNRSIELEETLQVAQVLSL